MWGTVVLAQRASSLALPAMLMLVCLLLDADRKKAIFCGFLAGLSLMFNYYVFVALMAVVGMLWLIERRPELLWFFFVAALTSAPFAVSALQQESGMLKLVLGWQYAPKDLSVIWFYLANLGIPLILALCALAWSTKRWTPFLAGWMAVVFLIPNLFVFSGIPWDMSKFFSFLWFPVCLLAATVLDKLKPALAFSLVALCVISPVLVSGWFITQHPVALSWDDVKTAQWIETHTPPDAVFVTESTLNLPTDLAGRLRLTTFIPYLSGYGFDPSVRDRQVRSVYCDSSDVALDAMRLNHASYILTRFEYPECSHAFKTDGRFKEVFSSGPDQVYALVAS